MADYYNNHKKSSPRRRPNEFFSSSEEEALLYMDTNYKSSDWPEKRIRVNKCLEEIKMLLPKGQSLNTIEALETVVAQFKKLKEKPDVPEPVYNKARVDSGKNSSQNTNLSQLDEEEILSIYNSVTYLDSVLKLLGSSCDATLTDVSPVLLKDWEQKNFSSSQYCSLKTDFPRLPSYKSSDKSIQLLGEIHDNPIWQEPFSSLCDSSNQEGTSHWSDKVNFATTPYQPSVFTKENLEMHQKRERLKYLELFENDKHLSKFIPSLQHRLRKRHAAYIEKDEQKESELLTQKKEAEYHTATKLRKDNSGSAVQMPQQDNFCRQMFNITSLETNNTTSQFLNNFVSFNREPCQQMYHPENIPRMPSLKLPSSSPQHVSAPQAKPPEQPFRFGQHSQFHEASRYYCPPPCMTVVSSLSSLPALSIPVHIGKPAKEKAQQSSTNMSVKSKNSSGQISLEWSESDNLTSSREPFWLENADVSNDTFLKYEVKLKDCEEDFLKDFQKLKQSEELFEQLVSCDDSDIESGSEIIFTPTPVRLQKKPDLIDTDTDSNLKNNLHLPSRNRKMKQRKKSYRESLRMPGPPTKSSSAILDKRKMHINRPGSADSSNASSGRKSSSGYDASLECGSSVTENLSSDDLSVFQHGYNLSMLSLKNQARSTKEPEQSNLVVEQFNELLNEMYKAEQYDDQIGMAGSKGVDMPYNREVLQSGGDSSIMESMPVACSNTTSTICTSFTAEQFPHSHPSNILKHFHETSSMLHTSSGVGTMSLIESSGSPNRLDEAISGDISSSFHSTLRKSNHSSDTCGGYKQKSCQVKGQGKSLSKVRGWSDHTQVLSAHQAMKQRESSESGLESDGSILASLVVTHSLPVSSLECCRSTLAPLVSGQEYDGSTLAPVVATHSLPVSDLECYRSTLAPPVTTHSLPVSDLECCRSTLAPPVTTHSLPVSDPEYDRLTLAPLVNTLSQEMTMNMLFSSLFPYDQY